MKLSIGMLLALSAPVSVRAQAAGGSALLVSERDDDLSQRVRLELVARGFAIVRDAHFDPAHPVERVRGLVVVIETSGAGVDIWAVSDAHEARLLSRVPVHDDAATSAVRVAEVARAYAGNVDPPRPAFGPSSPDGESAGVGVPSAPEPEGRPPEARPYEAHRPATAPRFDVFAEGTWTLPTSRFSSSFGANMGLRWHLHPRLSLGAFAGVPVVPSSIRTDVGAAHISPYFLGATMRVALLDERAHGWLLGLGAGLALQWVRTDGEARAPYETRSSSVWGAMPLVSIDVGHTLGETLVLHGAGVVGASVPSVAVRFADESVGSWGSPMVGLSIGLTVRVGKRASL